MNLEQIDLSRVRAITLDYWDTLVRDGDQRHFARREMRRALICEYVRHIDPSIAPDQIDSAVSSAARAAHVIWMKDHAPRPARARLQDAFAILGLPPHERALEVLATKVENVYRDMPALLFPMTATVVRQLSKVWPLGIISDTGQTPGAILSEQLSDAGLLRCFSSACYSDEIGVTKPNPTIFRDACSALAVPPEEVLHVGDNPKTDVEGALKMGMQCLHIAPRADPSYADTTGYGHVRNIDDLLYLTTTEEPRVNDRGL